MRVRAGESDVDRSLVTGESAPVAVGGDDELEAGTLNLTGAIDAVVVRPARQSFLAEMVRMLERAEAGRGSYVRVADRAARLYAPVVHLAAAATFAGWLVATGGDWRTALFIAISVLIITCPCALGLAVPAAQVVAAGRLFGEGILMKDGAALERLAGVDRVVFDKTGTLTTGSPTVTGGPAAAEERAAAAGLGRRSAHPVARAVAAHLAGPAATPTEVRELPGHGVEGRVAGRLARLGRADWVAEIASGRQRVGDGHGLRLRGRSGFDVLGGRGAAARRAGGGGCAARRRARHRDRLGRRGGAGRPRRGGARASGATASGSFRPTRSAVSRRCAPTGTGC